ncbi:predicted protein [Thalassiosira pseudonana CCMP1335]|uniref:Integrase zinc-binding domain-containing protein n=1 Tax=Thalassiosira pseudonana TaxID=35128 RepID=B8BQQ6_THAPS|nr:predicted protein [Thalassiosira pseudonana CCMP1335]EED96406.1 predicted protein [Thalassiosira pseudonana CCMP1335]|eukprot:g909.t1 g909   contig10:985608-986699(-)
MNPSTDWQPPSEDYAVPALPLLPPAEPVAPLPAAAAAALAAASTKQRELNAADHRIIISNAMSISDDEERDAALVAALRGVAKELEAAEEEHERTRKRLETARDLFDWATGALSGLPTAVSMEPTSDKMIRRRGRKRKGEDEEGEYDELFVPPNEGPLIPPLIAVSGGDLTEEQVAAHKDAFYSKITKGDISTFAEVHSYTPPVSQPNMKNQKQLDDCAYIAAHWDTGDGGTVNEFRRQHKNFYTKMKIVNESIGRRTGHHVRDLAGGAHKKVFCRYGKNGESLMYVSLEQLYDALFEIHVLKGHPGWQNSKRLVSLKYANIPQDQIRAFIDTCPHCYGSKSRIPAKRSRKEETAAVALHTMI